MRFRHIRGKIALLLSVGMLVTGIPQVGYGYASEELEIPEDRSNLEQDIEALEDSVEGIDYAAGELVYPCSSQSKAQEAADEYTSYTGRKVTVKDFSFGIAVLSIGKALDNPDDEVICEAESVEDYIKLAADENNELPAVYANNFMELDSVVPDTSNENFSDPNTKWNLESGEYNPQFQWMHELVGSKAVWDAMEKGYISTSSDRFSSYEESLRNTVVAVVDTGINKNGPDFFEDVLSANGEIISRPIYVGGYDFYNDNNVTFQDGHGHGTLVAGIIADAANDYQGRGIAAGVRIMPLRVTDDSAGSITTVRTARAINYATASRLLYDGMSREEAANISEDYRTVEPYNVQAMNISIGGYQYNSLYVDVINKATRAGIVICTSAGNDDTSGGHYPSGYDNTVCVAALNSKYEKSAFSNYGEDVDIAAPGGEDTNRASYDSYNFRVKETGIANKYINDTSKYSVCQLMFGSGKNESVYIKGNFGTSFSSPVVTASVALIKAKYPDMTYSEVVNLLKETATKAKSRDVGAGCVNVARALGVEDCAPEPDCSVTDGEIISDSLDVKLSINNDDAVIYYSITGTSADSKITYESEEIEYDYNDPSESIHIDIDDFDSSTTQVILRTYSVLYGNVSNSKSYTYYFDNHAVRSISINSISGENTVVVGKNLSLKASVWPSNAVNKEVTWYSSNTSVARVSSKGVVTAVSEGDAVITARSKDGYENISDNFVVHVIPKVTNVEIELPDAGISMYNANTILLSTELGKSTYDMSLYRQIGPDEYKGKVKIWPETALKSVTYKSSNTKVVTVDKYGMVEAVGYGKATVTVTAADGSCKKDIQKFRVASPVKSIQIVDKNTSATMDKIASGYKFTPKVIFNEGKSVPENKKLNWSIVEASDADGNWVPNAKVATIDVNTGVVKANIHAGVTAPVTLTIRATSASYGVSEEKAITIYRKTSSMSVKTDSSYYGSGVFNLYTSSYGYDLKTCIDVKASGGLLDETMKLVSVTSSNPEIVCPTESIGSLDNIRLRIFGEDTATITVKILDGTKKSVKFKIRTRLSSSSSKAGIVCESGDNIYYPGKKLKYAMRRGHDLEYSRVEYSFLNSDGYKINSPYIEVDNNGYVYEKPNGAKLTEPMNIRLYGKLIDVTGSGIIGIEMYPYATSKVNLEDAVLVNGKGSIIRKDNTVTLTQVGAKALLVPASLPEKACQSHYVYSTSNAGVVKVYTDGTIEAIKNGTATIYITAGDGSRKKTSVKVNVSQDKITNLNLNETILNLGTIASGDKKTSQEIYISSFAPDSACANVTVTTSNKKVATVTLKKKLSQNDADVYVVTAVGKGKADIKFTATDGSNKSVVCKVNVTAPVTDIAISSSTKSFILKPNKSLKLKATVNKSASTQTVVYDFYGTEEEKEIMKQYVSLDKNKGTITARDSSVEYDTEHSVKIYAKATDYGECESYPVTIIVSPGKVLMKNLSIRSKTGYCEMESGKKLFVQATTSTDATDKRITWKVDNYIGGQIDNSGEPYATITSAGKLRAKPGATSRRQVLVTATAKDGSNVTASKIVTIYPATKRVDISSYELIRKDEEPVFVKGVHNITLGQQLVLSVNGVGYAESDIHMNEERTCQRFYVTYSGEDVGKVYINNSDGNSIIVKPVSKGTIMVYATAISGKRSSYSIRVK